jgi:hypothetical protein
MKIAGVRLLFAALPEMSLIPAQKIAPVAIRSVNRIREHSHLLSRDFKYLGGL